MQESRLFKIIYYLLDKGKATAPELAERFEVSVRTIYRDIDAISAAGVPIYVTTGRRGGIQLLDNYVLDKSMFSLAEKAEILSGLQSLMAVQYPNMDAILNKLGAIFQMRLTDWIEVDFSRWGFAWENESKLFGSLKEAIFEKRQVKFDYYSPQKKEAREVQPLKLVYKDKAWYLYGFCLLRNAHRLFRLSRIKQLALTNIHFERDTRAAKEIFPKPEAMGPLVDMELYFASGVGFRLYDTLNDSAIHPEKEGYRVTLTLPQNEWLYDFLLSFGDKVTIVRPNALRQTIAAKSEAAMRHHKGELP